MPRPYCVHLRAAGVLDHRLRRFLALAARPPGPLRAGAPANVTSRCRTGVPEQTSASEAGCSAVDLSGTSTARSSPRSRRARPSRRGIGSLSLLRSSSLAWWPSGASPGLAADEAAGFQLVARQTPARHRHHFNANAEGRAKLRLDAAEVGGPG